MAVTYFLKDKRGIKTTIDEVEERTFVDVTLYQRQTYRDDPTALLNYTNVAGNELEWSSAALAQMGASLLVYTCFVTGSA